MNIFFLYQKIKRISYSPIVILYIAYYLLLTYFSMPLNWVILFFNIIFNLFLWWDHIIFHLFKFLHFLIYFCSIFVKLMDVCYYSLNYCLWNRQPTHEDIINIVHRMYEKDGISRDAVVRIVDTFPNQGISLFYIAL